jgi:predicted RNA binding protein YcfA (HicA-like mRNA interferase family)
MTRLPILNAKGLERVLLNQTIPHHPGRDLARPLVREILREVELPPEQFLEELRKA